MSTEVSPEKFIEIWMETMKEGGYQEQVAQKLGMTRQAVSQRAGRMRKQGVKLPEFNRVWQSSLRGKSKELNNLIERLL